MSCLYIFLLCCPKAKEKKMAYKKYWSGMLAVAVVFGMAVIGCDAGSDGGNDDPIVVDLSLPAVQNTASFNGTFVSTENEAFELIGDAINALGEYTSTPGGVGEPGGKNFDGRSIFRSMSRAIKTEPVDVIYDHEKLAEGVVATGFVKGYYKQSVANDDKPGMSVGDYREMSMKCKLAVDFKDIQQEPFKFDGKYIYDINLFEKQLVTSLDPDKLTLTVRGNSANGYVLSVSKEGKGLKFVMQYTADINFNFTGDDPNEALDYLLKKAKLKLIVDVYDNANVKQYSKIITDYKEMGWFLGDSINGL